MRRLRDSERGQAVIEFALVIPMLLLLVVGMIDFGRAIFTWFDLNGAANTAARYAVVNRYPGCYADTDPCTGFAAYVATLPRASGATVTTCYVDVDGSDASGVGPTTGDTVRVAVSSTFEFFKAVGLFDLHLTGRAALRLEQSNPTRIGIADADTCT